MFESLFKQKYDNELFFQLLKCEELQPFFVLYDRKFTIFVFKTVSWTKQGI